MVIQCFLGVFLFYVHGQVDSDSPRPVTSSLYIWHSTPGGQEWQGLVPGNNSASSCAGYMTTDTGLRLCASVSVGVKVRIVPGATLF